MHGWESEQRSNNFEACAHKYTTKSRTICWQPLEAKIRVTTNAARDDDIFYVIKNIINQQVNTEQIELMIKIKLIKEIKIIKIKMKIKIIINNLYNFIVFNIYFNCS